MQNIYSASTMRMWEAIRWILKKIKIEGDHKMDYSHSLKHGHTLPLPDPQVILEHSMNIMTVTSNVMSVTLYPLLHHISAVYFLSNLLLFVMCGSSFLMSVTKQDVVVAILRTALCMLIFFSLVDNILFLKKIKLKQSNCFLWARD